MYILIDEFGETYRADLITENEKNASDEGVLDIINAGDMTSYFRGEWIELAPWRG